MIDKEELNWKLNQVLYGLIISTKADDIFKEQLIKDLYDLVSEIKLELTGMCGMEEYLIYLKKLHEQEN